MKIAVKDITLAEGHPGMECTPLRERRVAVKKYRQPVVMKNGSGKYALHLGVLRLRKAIEQSQQHLECTVLEQADERDVREMRLVERYLCSAASALTLGVEMTEFRQEYGLSQQEFSRAVGISPGTVHHYESLHMTLAPALAEKLESGDLNFKEARCIADISDHGRQIVLAKPFIDGALSSVHVEQLVSMAKASPQTPAEDVVERLMAQLRTAPRSAARKGADEGVAAAPAKEHLEDRVLALAGDLAEMIMRDVEEYRRLRLISSMRILDSRLKAALKALNTAGTGQTDVLEPLSSRVADEAAAASA